jgi:hypothetical protein
MRTGLFLMRILHPSSVIHPSFRLPTSFFRAALVLVLWANDLRYYNKKHVSSSVTTVASSLIVSHLPNISQRTLVLHEEL